MKPSDSKDSKEKKSRKPEKAALRPKKKDGCCSPNCALFTIALSLFLAALFCGTSLWIPASRIKNLYIRSAALAAADAFSAFASLTGLDKAVPSLRSKFISAAGLEGNIDWDLRYFNLRETYPPIARANPSGGAFSGEEASAPQAESLQPEGAIPSGNAFPIPAAETVQPAQPPPSCSDSSIHSSENPLRVYVFGDSQVYSLGIGLLRLAGKNSSIYVDYLQVNSSGFIRQDYFNWEQKLIDTFSDSPYDAGIVMMGMNDCQNFWTDDGTVAVKKTAFWDAAYKEKCRAIIDTALAYLPKLYWLGMPLVKDSALAGDLEYIERVQRSLAQEYSPERLVYVSLRDAIPGQGKPYADVFVTSGGKQFRVMSDDGNHFTVEGGQLAMKPVFDMLCRDFSFLELPVAHMP